MDSTSSPSIKVIYEMTKSNGDIGFLVVGSGVRFVEYGLTINPNEYWYEIDSIKNLNQHGEMAATSGDVSTNKLSSYKVQITQHDPAEVKLCRTI